MWWLNMRRVMPVAWYMQGVLTTHYRLFITTLGLLLLPGCVFFGVMSWITRRYDLKLTK